MNDEALPAGMRRAVRAVLLDPDGAVFLMGVPEPRSGRRWWFTPGGGIDAGEDDVTALRRELVEELSLELPASRIGPPLWRRCARFTWNGRRNQQIETFYLIKTERFTPDCCADGDPATGMHPTRPGWWTADAMRRTDDRIAPPNLAELVDQLRIDGAPPAVVSLTT